MMRTFLDVDRLGNETDRRFHAADLERVSGVVQVVPSAAFKLAPRVSPGAWGRNEQQLAVLAEEALDAGNAIEWLQVQRERWWNAQWRKKDPLYVVCRLNREQRDIATRLVSRDGFDPACFPEADKPLHEHNDAVMLAEIAGHRIDPPNAATHESRREADIAGASDRSGPECRGMFGGSSSSPLPQDLSVLISAERMSRPSAN